MPTFKEARILLALSQQKLADALEVDRHTVNKWECGRSQPALRLRKKLATVLGVSMEQIFQWFPPVPFFSPPPLVEIPLSDVLAAVDKELRRRDRVYPRLVATGKLTQSEAEQQYASMLEARRCVVEAMQEALPFGMGVSTHG